jgi:hypothetical protein
MSDTPNPTKEPNRWFRNVSLVAALSGLLMFGGYSVASAMTDSPSTSTESTSSESSETETNAPESSPEADDSQPPTEGHERMAKPDRSAPEGRSSDDRGPGRGDDCDHGQDAEQEDAEQEDAEQEDAEQEDATS